MLFSTLLYSALVAASPALEKRFGDAHGRITWYDGGVGACGRDLDANSQDFVAISAAKWADMYQGSNPNEAWMCNNRYIIVNYNGKQLRVKVEDKCPGCGYDDLDLSKHAFQQLADLGVGELLNVWYYWED
ncbi:hypothetical protein DICA3_D23442 [Diutina catenulata]